MLWLAGDNSPRIGGSPSWHSQSYCQLRQEQVTALSAPQVHALLDHMHARCAGSHSILAVVRRGTTLTRPESFLQSGPTQLLQSFFDRLPNHQTDIERGLTHPTQMESEVNHFSKALQTHMVGVTSVPALMLNFKSEIRHPHYWPDRRGGHLALPSSERQHHPRSQRRPWCAYNSTWPFQLSTRCLWWIILKHCISSGGAPAVSFTSVMRNIPMDSLIINKKGFSPKSMDRLKALMSKENRTQTLIKVRTEEATTHFDAPTSQDEESYDGNISEVDEEDAEVVLDKEDDAQMEVSKAAGADTLTDNEGQEETNKEDDGQTLKPADKKPVWKGSNRTSPGSWDGPVSYDKDVLAKGRKTKYPKDHMSVNCVQRAGRVLLMCSFDMLKNSQKMSDIYFHTNVTLVGGSTLQGGEWPNVPWYPDTPKAGAATQDLSWFIKIHSLCHPGLSISKQIASRSPYQALKN